MKKTLLTLLWFVNLGISAQNVINGHEYVDLGLPSGTKWATCNVGAKTPNNYGSFYGWGEINNMTDQNTRRRNGRKCSVDISGNPRYDVATAEWGYPWRMPTKKEIEELQKKCRWESVTQNGTKGIKVTGPNGKSIFLPAAGYKSWSKLELEGISGYYWSSTPYEEYKSSPCCYLNFNYRSVSVKWENFDIECTIRPVLK